MQGHRIRAMEQKGLNERKGRDKKVLSTHEREELGAWDRADPSSLAIDLKAPKIKITKQNETHICP